MYESECAVICCEKTKKVELASRPQRGHQKSNYMLVDAGGGTVDIAIYQIVSDSNNQSYVALRYSEGGCLGGGSTINTRFMEFLSSELFSDCEFTKYLNSSSRGENVDHHLEVNKIKNRIFEEQKKLFGKNESLDPGNFVTITLPSSLTTSYKEEMTKSLSQNPALKDFSLSEDHLFIPFTKLSEIFQPTIDKVLQSMSEALDSVRQSYITVDTVFLVGGFGACKYLQRCIKNHFQDRSFQYIIPTVPDLAVVKGAVLYKSDPSLVNSRVSSATYGVRGSLPLNPINTDLDSNTLPANHFITVVRKDELIESDKVVSMTYQPESIHQTKLEIELYKASHRDITKIDPTFCRRIAHRTVHLSQADLPGAQGGQIRRYIDINFDFAFAELLIVVFDSVTRLYSTFVFDYD